MEKKATTVERKSERSSSSRERSTRADETFAQLDAQLVALAQ